MKILAPCALALVLAGCIGSFPGDAPCQVPLAPESGSVEGSWSKPATIGTQTRSWQPSPLPWADADHLSQLDGLTLTLTWTNSPQGAADFGIAVGVDGLDQYWNEAFQTSFGTFTETRHLDRSQMQGNGWTTVDHLQSGPSISTGGYSATSTIPYTLTWDATFQAPPGDACVSTGSGSVSATATATLSATLQHRIA